METRVKRYSTKNRIKRSILKWLKKQIKNLLKNIGYLIVGLADIFYLIIRWFDNYVAKMFMKLPRIMKVIVIYLLVLNVCLDIYTIFNPIRHRDTIIVFNRETQAKIIPEEEIIEEFEDYCKFEGTSCLIESKGRKLGLTEEQILISIAISRWETGNYTSDAYKNKNNVGGMMCSDGLIVYDTLEDGIEAFLTNLKNNYFGIGLTTLELIQPKYCPVGAKNDPNGLNKYWLNGTNKLLKEMMGK